MLKGKTDLDYIVPNINHTAVDLLLDDSNQFFKMKQLKYAFTSHKSHWITSGAASKQQLTFALNYCCQK
jgi:hypothetical protein